MKKKNIIFIALVLILALCSIRCYLLNKNIPEKYVIDRYEVGQVIQLDAVSIEVKSFKTVQRSKAYDGDNQIGCILEINVKNTSKDIVDLIPLLQESKLSSGVYYQDYCNVDTDIKNVSAFPPKAEANLTFTYVIYKDALKYVKDKKEFKFYIGKREYENQIKDRLSKLQIYGKYVELRGDLE